jgi:xanthine dehydrogenase accessory factor
MVSFLNEVRERIDAGDPVALATVLSGPEVGARALIDPDRGIVAGDLPDGLAEAVGADARVLLADEQNRALEYGGVRVFIESLVPPPRLLVFGAVHIAEELCAMASRAGFEVTVCDPRPVFTTPERFPDAAAVIPGRPAEVAAELELDARTYVVVLSHDGRIEGDLLPVVLAAPVRYIGAMGSRRTSAARRERLAASGIADADLERIHGPVGLDLGAETPAEVAVSILAEMIRVRYGTGSAESLLGTSGPIHPRSGEPSP